MKRKRIILSVTAIAFVSLTTAWLFGWFSGDAALAEVQQLQTKMADPNLKEADRQALMEQLRAKMEALSTGARQAARENGRQMFEKRAEAHLDQILVMSPAERTKALDADIDRLEKMQAQFAADSKNGDQAGAQNRQRGRGPRSGNPSDEQRVDRLRNRLDRSTPEMRAKRNAYMQLINQRLQQRGLPPLTGRGGR